MSELRIQSRLMENHRFLFYPTIPIGDLTVTLVHYLRPQKPDDT